MCPGGSCPWHLLVREVLSQLLGLQSQAASHRRIERRCSWCLQITRHEQALGGCTLVRGRKTDAAGGSDGRSTKRSTLFAARQMFS